MYIRATTDLTQKHLKEILHYNPDTGEWYWLVSPAKIVRAGSRAGTISALGYRKIQIKGRLYLSGRLAFLYMTGDLPLGEVDHKDLDRSNDRWENLRKATRSQNIANSSGKAGRSLPKGVTLVRQGFRARVCLNGKQVYLGDFTTPEEASAAYNKAAKELHGVFARMSR